MHVPGTVSELVDENIEHTNDLRVLFFWADFHAPSSPGGDLDILFAQLAMLQPRVVFNKVNAEKNSTALIEKFKIKMIPTFVFLKRGKVVDLLEGADVAALAKRVEALAATKEKKDQKAELEKEETLTELMKASLKKLINSSPVMLFMKGCPSEPKCGFSRSCVALLNDENVPFGSFDILSDNDVRSALKKFSEWPTYPQLYVHGELVGGLDILKEMVEDGEGPLVEQLKLQSSATEKSLHETLSDLVSSAPVMLIMKGSPKNPQCGFSKKMVAMLRDHQVPFSTFDILKDDAARQDLKKFSNWPTFPQLYVNGEFIGGLDIVAEMAEDGNLAEQFGISKRSSSGQVDLQNLTSRSPVMVFMKGTPEAPECGFSRSLISLLNDAGFKYDTFNILADEKVRQELKAFSNFPTYPQVYIKGELIGGLDIVQELHEEDSLVALKPQ